LKLAVSQLAVASFLQQLEERQLADLRFSEVTRALRALSSAYVERRESALAGHKALDGAGKRAAFALYYGPLHFLLVQHIIKEIGPALAPGTVVDLGCGTGVAGAAIATSTTPPLKVLGFDTHPWTLDEARFTYQAFGLQHDVRRAHAAKTYFPSNTSIIVAAFVVNELNDKDRATLLDRTIRLKAAAPLSHVLIVEPISNRISPWWGEWAAEFTRIGGRADVWKARIDVPPLVRRLAKSSGLRPEMLTARSLFV
jgi:SAM-dependent methyltransferase